MSKTDDTFLGRWSRKKLEPEVTEPAEEQEVEAAAEEELTDEEILEQLELPNPDEMKGGDDFAAFMNSAVPDHLRKRALRKLWLSNPALANLDGLVEYGEDYTDAAMVPEVLNTAYKVGRGFLKDILEEDPEAAEPNEQEPNEPEGEPPVLADSSYGDPEEDIAPTEDTGSEDFEPPFEVAEVDMPKHHPRPRMVFSTD